MSVRDDQHLLCIAVNDRTASSRQLAIRWSTATGVLKSASSIRRLLLHRELRVRGAIIQDPLHSEPSTAASAMGSCTELGKLIGAKLSFQMNHFSTCGTMMAAFVLDRLPV